MPDSRTPRRRRAPRARRPAEAEPEDEAPRRAPPARGSPKVVAAKQIPPETLDQDALRVVSRLSRQGHEAYLVGGCVRDLLLGRKPKDFDVATAAHPRQVKRLFRNGRIIGRRFRLVHVTYGDNVIETATFRREPDREGVPAGSDLLITEDNEYGTAEQDARRRDFTINALFHDPGRQRILDYVGGLEDLENGVLRTIGDPAVRMAEDPVRILRAIKFATRLGFRIDDDTWEAMGHVAPELVRSAKPRVLEEILRLLRGGTALGAFRMLRACGALEAILPEVDDFLGRRDDPDPVVHDRADLYWRLLEALDADVHAGRIPTTPVCVAVLFLRIIEREADPALRTLPGPAPADLGTAAAEVLEPWSAFARLSRKDASRARRIIAHQRRFTQPTSKRFRPLLFVRGEDFLEALDLFRLRSAAWGQGWDVYEAWVDRHRRAGDVPAEELDGARPKRRRQRRRRKSGGKSDSDSDPEP